MVEYRRIDFSDDNNLWKIIHWCGGALAVDNRISLISDFMEYFAEDGDYIVHGADGRFYPCKPEDLSFAFSLECS